MAAEGTQGFVPLQEVWGEYLLSDGIRLWARHVITLVVKEEEADPAGKYGTFRGHTLLELSAPKSLRGEPTLGIFDYETRPILKEYDSFETVHGAEATYRLADGSLIRLRYAPTKIRRTDAFNANGEPILLVQGETEIVHDPSFEQIRIEQARAKTERPSKSRKKR